MLVNQEGMCEGFARQIRTINVLIVSNLHVLKMSVLLLVAPVVTVVIPFFMKTLVSLLELFVVVFVAVLIGAFVVFFVA